MSSKLLYLSDMNTWCSNCDVMTISTQIPRVFEDLPRVFSLGKATFADLNSSLKTLGHLLSASSDENCAAVHEETTLPINTGTLVPLASCYSDKRLSTSAGSWTSAVGWLAKLTLLRTNSTHRKVHLN